jgi:hypothetical protein
MPKRSNQFQRLITLINASLADDAQVIESAMLTDKITGEQREVDVLIKTKTAGYEVNIAIEVVARGRKVDTTWVEGMCLKHSSLPTDKLILVAEKGFSTPALKKAEFYRAEAVKVDIALATDWKLVTELTSTGFFEITSFNYSCSVIYKADSGHRRKADISNDSYIISESNKIILDEFVHYVLSLPETKNILYPRITSMNERQFWFSYSPKPDKSYYVEVHGVMTRILEIWVGLDVDHKSTPVIHSAEKREQQWVHYTALKSSNSPD